MSLNEMFLKKSTSERAIPPTAIKKFLKILSPVYENFI